MSHLDAVYAVTLEAVRGELAAICSVVVVSTPAVRDALRERRIKKFREMSKIEVRYTE